jgi:hypothetical protein
MKIEIENYLGHDIYYEDTIDKFVCDIEIDGNVVNSKRQSLNDVRRTVDVFIKENIGFKPFRALMKSPLKYEYQFSEVNIIGIRIDGKFVIKESIYPIKFLNKEESKRLMRHDQKAVEEQDIIEDELEIAKKNRNGKLMRLRDSLIPIDLSKYNLK